MDFCCKEKSFLGIRFFILTLILVVKSFVVAKNVCSVFEISYFDISESPNLHPVKVGGQERAMFMRMGMQSVRYFLWKVRPSCADMLHFC